MRYYSQRSLPNATTNLILKRIDDGVNVAQWLASLETFAGAFYKVFNKVEIGGLLGYLIKRVNNGHISELGVVRSLLKKTGGYGFAETDSIASLSEDQLEGRCGSLLLKRETSDFGIVEEFNVDSSRCLRSELQKNSCGVSMLILLMQLQTKLMYDQSENSPKEIKLIGHLYDTCQKTINILLPFLTDGSQDMPSKNTPAHPGAIAQYATAMPSLGTLNTKFGMSNTSIWMVSRPLLRAAAIMSADGRTKDNGNNQDLPPYLQRYHPTSKDLLQDCKDMVDESCWKHITPLVFQVFYTYQVNDLYCPEDCYNREISRLSDNITNLEIFEKGGREAAGMQASLMSKAVAAGGTHREIRDAMTFTREHKTQLERLRRKVEVLTSDAKRQTEHCNNVQKKMQQEKEKLFSNLEGQNGEIRTTSVFIANCIYPRCLQSPEDAMYCFRFIKVLHDIKTPGFKTLELIDGIVNATVGALYSVTEDEAGCLGIFIEKLWQLITEWRYDEKRYTSEVSKTVSSACY